MLVMDCQRTHELLSPLIDGELPLDLSRSVLAHMEGCARCRTDAASLRSLSLVIREMCEKAPTGLSARVLSEARALQGRSHSWVQGIVSLWPRGAAILAGAASVTLFLSPLTSAPSLPVKSRSPLHYLALESQAGLELAGSFSGDFRVLAKRPEDRLMYDLAGGR